MNRESGQPHMQEEKQVATLGGGCFWCLEAVFDALQGVEQAVSGYAGGHVPNPTYRQVCSGATGHTEVVQITFDSRVISFRQIVITPKLAKLRKQFRERRKKQTAA